MRIGILGGTFDPIHKGHLILAEEVMEKLTLAKVIFVPCNSPPHKSREDIASPEDRYRMAELATQSNPSFEVSRIEIERGGVSYSVQTLRELKKGSKDDFFFITGSDSLEELILWKDLDDIFGLAKFVVAERPGYSVDKAPKEAKLIRISSFDVSSSEIRQRLRDGSPIRDLVPEPVREYILRKKLYR